MVVVQGCTSTYESHWGESHSRDVHIQIKLVKPPNLVNANWTNEVFSICIYIYILLLLLLSLLLLYYYQYYYYHYYYQCYYTQTPRFAQAQNSVNTREFCTRSNNGKDFMFNYVAREITRTCCFYISYNQNMSLLHITINHTVIRVSYRVSRRYQNQYHHHHRHPHHLHHHHHHHRHPHHHHHRHRHLGLPRRSLRVRANLMVLPYMMMMIIIIL